MSGTPIWIVDSEHWPRAFLRAELIERGYEAVGFVTVIECLLQLAKARSRPALVLIDLQGQEMKEKQLSTLLGEGVPVLAIGGATEWEDERLRMRPWAGFLRRPLTVGAIADEVARGLSRHLR